MLHDLKTACRELAKNRWFTCVTVLTLALGIGANPAIFSVVNNILLLSLPYPDSDRLVYLRISIPRSVFAISPPSLVAESWREQARSFEGVEGYSSRDVLAYDANGARVVRGMRITPGLPALLRVAPLLGRGFTTADAEAGAPAVVMLSYEMWQRDYGGASDVLGRAITLDEAPHVVIGVMPARWDAFAGPIRSDVWFPLSAPSCRPDAPVRISTRSTCSAAFGPASRCDVATVEVDALAKRALAEAPRPMFGP